MLHLRHDLKVLDRTGCHGGDHAGASVCNRAIEQLSGEQPNVCKEFAASVLSCHVGGRTDCYACCFNYVHRCAGRYAELR